MSSSEEDELDLSKAKGGGGRFAGGRVQSVLLGKKPPSSTPQGAPTTAPPSTLAAGCKGGALATPARGVTPREHAAVRGVDHDDHAGRPEPQRPVGDLVWSARRSGSCSRRECTRDPEKKARLTRRPARPRPGPRRHARARQRGPWTLTLPARRLGCTATGGVARARRPQQPTPSSRSAAAAADDSEDEDDEGAPWTARKARAGPPASALAAGGGTAAKDDKRGEGDENFEPAFTIRTPENWGSASPGLNIQANTSELVKAHEAAIEARRREIERAQGQLDEAMHQLELARQHEERVLEEKIAIFRQ